MCQECGKQVNLLSIGLFFCGASCQQRCYRRRKKGGPEAPLGPPVRGRPKRVHPPDWVCASCGSKPTLSAVGDYCSNACAKRESRKKRKLNMGKASFCFTKIMLVIITF